MAAFRVRAAAGGPLPPPPSLFLPWTPGSGARASEGVVANARVRTPIYPMATLHGSSSGARCAQGTPSATSRFTPRFPPGASCPSVCTWYVSTPASQRRHPLVQREQESLINVKCTQRPAPPRARDARVANCCTVLGCCPREGRRAECVLGFCDAQGGIGGPRRIAGVEGGPPEAAPLGSPLPPPSLTPCRRLAVEHR